MSKRWNPPGTFREPVAGNLRAFGFTELEGARINLTDPPVSEKQQRLMCADLGRARAGKKTRTGMSESQLEDFCAPVKKRGRR